MPSKPKAFDALEIVQRLRAKQLWAAIAKSNWNTISYDEAMLVVIGASPKEVLAAINWAAAQFPPLVSLYSGSGRTARWERYVEVVEDWTEKLQLPTIVCKECGASFSPANPQAEYCSALCRRVVDNRRRRRATQEGRT